MELFAVQPWITELLKAKMPRPFASACTFLTMPTDPTKTPMPNPVTVQCSTVTSLCADALIPSGVSLELPGPVIENPFRSIVTFAAVTLIALVLAGAVRLPVSR